MRSVYISAHTWGFVALAVFALVALVAPEPDKLETVGVLFGAVTFVFATMSGFFLTRLNHRFDTVRNEISQEDANFLSLYYYAKVVGGQTHEYIRKVIDEYYLTTFEEQLNTYHKPTRDEYAALYDVFNLPEAEEKANRPQFRGVYEKIGEIISDIEKHRNIIARAGEEYLTRAMWSIVAVLAIIVIVSIFLIRDGSLFFDVSAVLLSTTVVVIVALMYDLERFRLGGVPLAAESGYEMFEAMGLPRYISEKKLNAGRIRIPLSIGQVRVGDVDPETGKRVLRTVEVSSLPKEWTY